MKSRNLKIQAAEKALEDALKVNTDLELDVEAKDFKIRMIEMKLAECHSHSKIDNVANHLKNNITEDYVITVEKRNEESSLFTQIKEKDDIIKQVTETLTDYRNNNDDLAAELQSKDSVIKMERKKLADLMTVFSGLSAKIKEKDAWIEQANGTLNEFRKDNDALASKLNTEQKNLADLRIVNSDISAKIKLKEEWICKAQTYINDLKDANAKLFH